MGAKIVDHSGHQGIFFSWRLAHIMPLQLPDVFLNSSSSGPGVQEKSGDVLSFDRSDRQPGLLSLLHFYKFPVLHSCVNTPEHCCCGITDNTSKLFFSKYIFPSYINKVAVNLIQVFLSSGICKATTTTWYQTTWLSGTNREHK